MAKSLRNKSKQANRRKKRNDEQSHYAIVEAQRLKAVSARLLGKDKEGEGEGAEAVVEAEGEGEGMEAEVEMAERESAIPSFYVA